jgi:23S rRNA (uracil1939-C5)-methyltransferase
MKKKKTIIIEKVALTGIADKGKCIGKTPDGMIAFVEGGVPGDVVDMRVQKKKNGYYEGVAVFFHELSPERVEPFCSHFGVCGGCKWQHLAYEAQAKYKQEVVENAFRHLAKVPVGEFLPIITCDPDRYYRNKLEFTFSNRRWLTQEEMNAGHPPEENVLGFHRPGAFDKIVNIDKCYLQEDPSNAIRNFIREIAHQQELTFYDVKKHEGYLRNVIIRRAATGEIMVILSLQYEDQALRIALLEAIKTQFPEITSLHYCINGKLNDSLYDIKIHTYAGKGYIEDKLGEVRFKIGPKSFFQTNTRQAERLFDVVLDFAALKGDENVYDLYTGLGSIALYMARRCGAVTGIEEIAAAIEDAKVNAAFNDINNCLFYAGDVRNILTKEFALEHGKPDLLITDPPRMGMHPDVTQMLLELEAPRLIYVSCNPATQARDLQILSSKYDVIKVQPVDMFPHTHHIENVALLELRSMTN